MRLLQLVQGEFELREVTGDQDLIQAPEVVSAQTRALQVRKFKLYQDRALQSSKYNRESMTEIVFEVREAQEGGYEANALGASIFTQGDTLDDVRSNILEAVECHFEESERPRWVRVLFMHEEVLPVADSA